MKYINVVGNSAMGKSTFSKQLAKKLSLAYIELDNLYWKNNWEEPSNLEFFAKIKDQMDQYSDGWVMDGNYTKSIPVKWKHVDTVIWLDYPFHLNFYRSVKRALILSTVKKQLWPDSNNHESFQKLFSRRSIVLWMMQQYRINREKYIALMATKQYEHVNFIHLTSPKQAEDFLNSLDSFVLSNLQL